MAAKDDKSKTSKTARVMNLLSKKQDAPLPEEGSAAEPVSAAPAPAAPAPAAAAPILTPLGAEAAVSDQIRSALENVLEEELTPRVPAPPAAEEFFPSFDPPVPQAAPAPKPEPQPEPQPEPEPEPAPRPEQEEPVPGPRFMGYTNVMQVLVEERAPKYVKMFGLCQCRRCLEDVKALALNHLPPKYVVMDVGDMIPKLTFYEGKYSSDITAQLLQACKKVMERPHHDRP